MRLVTQIKLVPGKEQCESLKKTLTTANEACSFVSTHAWETKHFGQFILQKECYRQVRDQFRLSAQVAVQVIRKVVDSYKLDKKAQRTFNKFGSIPYDDRILSWAMTKQMVSIWTIDGRQPMSFVCGPKQKELLQYRQGESDLVFRDNDFYLYVGINLEEPAPKKVKDFLGVDLGIVNIATDSHGNNYSGKVVNALRSRHRKLRTKLQKKGTKSAKRLLRKRNRKETRFAKDVNHCISKKIVAEAKRTNLGIAVEDLKGIRDRTRVKKSQRATHSSWSFFQLRSFIEYKARMEEIPFQAVDPKNTSRICPICDHVSSKNRPNRDTFVCEICGFSGPSDFIAAGNIARRAVVNQPYTDAA